MEDPNRSITLSNTNSNCQSSGSNSPFELLDHIILQSPESHIQEHETVLSIEEDHNPEKWCNESSRIQTIELSRSSTKEEKQRQNEEIVVNTSASSETSSLWESISIPTTNSRSNLEINENCKLFISSERTYCSVGMEEKAASSNNTTNKPASMWLFNAADLCDEIEPIYTPPPSVTHNPTLHTRSVDCKVTTYEIRDQFSLESGFPKTKLNSSTTKITQLSKKSDIEKHKGQILFQNSIPQYSGHNMKPEDHYTSDLSLPSVYSDEYSSGGVCEMNDFIGSAYNSLCDATSDYLSESTNYSYPDTPFNSIVHVAKDIKVYEFEDEGASQVEQLVSIPLKIPKRTFDETAPIVSGGASIKDFVPNKPESPAVRRRTDTCPILSGGSVDLEVVEVKPINKIFNNSVKSWVVDFNELKIEEECKKSNVLTDTESVSFSQKNNLGFYVDFNAIRTPEDEHKMLIAKSASSDRHRNLDDKFKKRSTGFFIDFSDSDVSRSETPKWEHNVETTKQSTDKKGSISMFIDFGQEHTKSHLKKVNDFSSLSIESSFEKSDTEDKKSCFMFIENDSSPIMKRSLPNNLPKSEIKRHSWNTSETPLDDDQIQLKKKHYQRSTSVSNEKSIGIVNPIEKILSKTSSMNIDSSLSLCEDISCSKSLSNFSTTSGTISHSSDDDGIKMSDQRNEDLVNCLTQSGRRKQKDAKINETFDKSSQGSDVTDGMLSPDISTATDTATEDVTFQNPPDNNLEADGLKVDLNSCVKSTGSVKMETIPEFTESPLKKTLQETVEEQMLLLESLSENVEVQQSFVKLSDLDTKPTKFELHTNNYQYMSSSTSSRVARIFHDPPPRQPWNMSRSNPGNNVVNLASSVENSKSLSRLFPHLSKAFSSSVPSDVGFSSSGTDFNDFVKSDYSYTSTSNTSSRSGMISDSADESSLSYRQPRRLGEDLLKMFLQEIATDVFIEAGSRKIRAHKCILRSRCQYFAAILSGGYVQNAGNLISLPGYSFAAVHFALCHIYSGASHPPEGISLMELAALSDLLGLEGLKEVTTYALKTNYCHNFHKPCTGCIDGILQVLPVSLNHGLDDLYRKCLKWVCRHFVKVWTTRAFSLLPGDVIQRCRQQVVAHMTSETVLNIYLDCEQILVFSLEPSRCAITVDNVLQDLMDSARCYIMDHFASLIASDSFLSLGHGQKWTISRLEHMILKTAACLSPDQACKSYPRAVRLNQLLTAKIITPHDSVISLRQVDDDMYWNEEFVRLVSAVLSAVEQCLIRQCGRAMRVSAWQRMDVELQIKIQKLACLSEPEERKLRSSINTSSKTSLHSSQTSNYSRTNDLRQVRLAIQAHTKKTQMHDDRQMETLIPTKAIDKQSGRKELQSELELNRIKRFSCKTEGVERLTNQKHRRTQSDDFEQHVKGKVEIKSRYMEPKKTRTPLFEKKSQLQKHTKQISSSDSSRTSSPAFVRKRAQHGMHSNELNKNPKLSNMSLDSLSSPAKIRSQTIGNKQENVEISMDSLIGSIKTETTMSQESLLYQLAAYRTSHESVDRSRKANLKICSQPTVQGQSNLKKPNNKTFDVLKSTFSATQKKISIKHEAKEPLVPKSFLSQKSKEILAKRATKSVSNKTSSSISKLSTTSSTTSSPKFNEINKSKSTSVILRKNDPINLPVHPKKKIYNTTLHLRKSAQLPESPRSTEKVIVKKTNFKVLTKNQKIEKKTEEKKSKAGIEKQKKESREKEETPECMVRSNTFSKETSENPVELLKIINLIE